ncbi:MAG TPA: hypothetical protein VGL28_07180 [Steroidobacteraceae bacterium]
MPADNSNVSLIPSSRFDFRAGASPVDPWARARRKFLKLFPRGFRDQTYLAWERDYKWSAHREWLAQLDHSALTRLLRQGKYLQVASIAVRIESGRSLLFSFEKMALRDAVREEHGARLFAEGLGAFLYGSELPARRFENWCSAVAALPRRQTRVLTWPLVTVFGFLARPRAHVFLKPLAMKRAAGKLGYDLQYSPRPNWRTYSSFLGLARGTRAAISDLRPRDMIDVQSFLWVLGSDEYN